MRFYIDVGHGGEDSIGKDTGTHGVHNNVTYKENEVNLKIALEVRQKLWDLGHTVTLSRSTNENFGGLVTKSDGSKYGRVDSNIINSANACRTGEYDAMISIHNNSYDKATARGHVLIYKTGNNTETKSKTMANYLSLQLTKLLPVNDIRTTKTKAGTDYYGILRLQDKPGVLVECAFMSNADDMALLADDNTIKSFGEVIANGLHKYSGETAPAKKAETAAETTVKETTVTETVDYESLYNDIKSKYDKVTSVCNEALEKVNTLEKENANLKSQLSGTISGKQLISYIQANMLS